MPARRPSPRRVHSPRGGSEPLRCVRRRNRLWVTDRGATNTDRVPTSNVSGSAATREVAERPPLWTAPAGQIAGSRSRPAVGPSVPLPVVVAGPDQAAGHEDRSTMEVLTRCWVPRLGEMRPRRAKKRLPLPAWLWKPCWLLTDCQDDSARLAGNRDVVRVFFPGSTAGSAKMRAISSRT